MAGGSGAGVGSERVVDDLRTLKVLADPLRYRMLDLLTRPLSVRELAAALGRPADRLYYHLNRLHVAGLVERVGDQRWRTVDRRLRIDPGSSLPREAVAGLVGQAFDGIGRAYRAAVEAGPAEDGVKRTFLLHSVLRLTEAQRVELAERLNALAAEFVGLARANEEHDRGEVFGIVTGMYRAVEDGDGARDEEERRGDAEA